MTEYWIRYDPENSGAFLRTMRALHGATTPIDIERGREALRDASELHQMTDEVLDAAQLTVVEVQTISLRYGLNATNTPYSLEQVGEILERERIEVRQIELRALKKLADPKVRQALGLENQL
jgi:DNA-directed RNA polymerase sigma subunit (sigma70/sigma32)